MISPYLDQALDFTDEAEREAWLTALREHEPVVASELRAILDEHHAIVREGYLENRAPSPRERTSSRARRQASRSAPTRSRRRSGRAA